MKMQRNSRLDWLIYSVGILLIGISVAFGHGDEDHDEQAEAAEETQAVAVDSTQALLRDSIFATIQEGFVALKPIFKKGCFDCHSDQTDYPWYYKLPLVKGMIDDDIKTAHKHMDMSDGFPFKGHGSPPNDLAAIREQLTEGEMPPWNYRMMHWSAKPSDVERDSIYAWIDRSLDALATIGMQPTEEDEE